MEPAARNGIGFFRFTTMAVRHSFRDFKVLKDMIYGTLLAAIGLFIQVWKHLIPIQDWHQNWRWWLISVLGPYLLVLACHALYRAVIAPWRLYNKLSAESQEQLTSLKKLKPLDTSNRDWRKEWKEQSKAFKEMISPSLIRADFTDTSAGRIWRIGASGATARHIETLCTVAGRMLISSQKISNDLSYLIRSEPNPAWRWLYFLKEQKRGFELFGIGAEEQMPDGETRLVIGGHT